MMQNVKTPHEIKQGVSYKAVQGLKLEEEEATWQNKEEVTSLESSKPSKWLRGHM